jgi:hypothetical protein
MKKRGFSMVLLCALLLLLVPQAASARSHWGFYTGVVPTYTYVTPYSYGYSYGYPYYYAPYYGYPPYSGYYYMYPRHEWGHMWNGHEWHESHEHGHHH